MRPQPAQLPRTGAAHRVRCATLLPTKPLPARQPQIGDARNALQRVARRILNPPLVQQRAIESVHHALPAPRDSSSQAPARPLPTEYACRALLPVEPIFSSRAPAQIRPIEFAPIAAIAQMGRLSKWFHARHLPIERAARVRAFAPRVFTRQWYVLLRQIAYALPV